MTKPIKRKWGGYGGECRGVWRSVEWPCAAGMFSFQTRGTMLSLSKQMK